jgi:hypothetical protein
MYTTDKYAVAYLYTHTYINEYRLLVMRKLIKCNANLSDGNMEIIIKNPLVINPNIYFKKFKY